MNTREWEIRKTMATKECENQSEFMNTNSDLSNHNNSFDQISNENRVIRKRGRPRKHNLDDNGDGDHNKQLQLLQEPRSRGRPKGSKNKNKHNQHSSIFDHIPGVVTLKDCTYHIMTVNQGENIVSKMMNLPTRDRKVTIFCVRGTITHIQITHPSGHQQRFEGLYKILSMFLLWDNECGNNKFEVEFSDFNNKVDFGIASVLVGCTPIEIFLGSFERNKQPKSKVAMQASSMATTHNPFGTPLLLNNNSDVNGDQEAYIPLRPPVSMVPAPPMSTVITPFSINNGPNMNTFMF